LYCWLKLDKITNKVQIGYQGAETNPQAQMRIFLVWAFFYSKLERTGMPEYTEEDLKGLSDEERAAVLEEDKESTDPVEDIDETDENDELEETDEPTEEVEPDKPDVVEEPEEIPEPVKDPPAEKVVEKLVVKLPTELADHFKAKISALQKRYDDGELEIFDLLNERDKVNREIFKGEVEESDKANDKRDWQ